MTPKSELEILVIRRFVNEDKHKRFIQLVTSLKNRGKFIQELPHFRFFKSELLTRVVGDEEPLIIETLRKEQIPYEQCYVISAASSIDARTLDIGEAIRHPTAYNMGTILVFGHANLIFFEGENIKSRFISKRVG